MLEVADRHSLPVISIVDTPGAYPGVAAEQHGQGGAIARSQAKMVALGVPTVACNARRFRSPGHVRSRPVWGQTPVVTAADSRRSAGAKEPNVG